MNGLDFIWDGLFWQQQAVRLSLTLLHFVWQGVLVGIVAAVVLKCCNRKSANTRHLIACAAFFSLPLLALATFFIVEPPANVAAVSPDSVRNKATPPTEPLALTESSGQPLSNETSESSTSALPSETEFKPMAGGSPPVKALVEAVPETLPAGKSGLEALSPFLPLIAVAYVIGALLLLLRLHLQIYRGSRLCSRSPIVQDSALLKLFAKLAQQAGLKCVPAIRYCDRLVVPTVVGIFKPVVSSACLAHFSTDDRRVSCDFTS